MIDNATLNNNRVQISIIEIDGRKLIVYLKTVGMYEVMIEDVKTGERVFSSSSFKTMEEAFNDAFKKFSK